MPIRKKNKTKNQSFFDYTLLFVVIFLIAFGLIMIYSTSSYEATGQLGDSTYYLRHQFVATIAGAFVMFITTMIDYHRWEKYAFIGMGVSIILIFLISVSQKIKNPCFFRNVNGKPSVPRSKL